MEIMIHSKVLSWITQEGIYIAPSAYESWFITDALYEDLDFTIRAVEYLKPLDTENFR
jgi:glutamate-1-semialdehyde 2,1-aminomutase